MRRSRTQILVVDDEPTQGAALREAFVRAGYQVTLSDSSVKAAVLAQRQEFHALVIDCMLPRMNGVDLVEEIKQLAVNPPVVILYSGIFKERAFAKEATERTGAVAFLTKPFELTEVLNLLNEHFPETTAVGPAEDGVISLYGAAALDDAAMVRLISNEPTLSGVHLPMLYRRLQASRMTGELSMVTSTGGLNTISLYRGRIFAVRTPDKDSVFGGLAVSLGFASAPEVLAATQNPERKMMGQKLIESMSLSPHAIQLVLEEQLALRLSQTIEDGVVTLDWTTRVYGEPEFTLNLERFQQLGDAWTSSKIGAEAIRAEFAAWGDHTLEARDGRPTPTATTLGERLEGGDLVALLRDLLAGNLAVGPRVKAADFRFLENRLTHLLESYQTQNYFQILAVGERAQASEINRAFEDLDRHFNPANLPEGCPASVLVKATQVFKAIEIAHRTLADEAARHRYVMQQQNMRAQATLENEPLMRAAMLQLQNDQPYEAGRAFQRLLDKRVEFPDLRAYRLWAGLLCDRRYDEITFDNIPPEERHSAPYHMARGTFFRIRGDYTRALECFQAAHAVDPRLTMARTEFEKTRAEYEGRTGRAVVGDVQTMFRKIRRSG